MINRSSMRKQLSDGQKTVKKVMKEFKRGELNIGKSPKKVNPENKQ